GTITRTDGAVINFQNIEAIVDINGNVLRGALVSTAVRELGVSVNIEPADAYTLSDVTLTLGSSEAGVLARADGTPIAPQADGTYLVSSGDLAGLLVISSPADVIIVEASVSAVPEDDGATLVASAQVSSHPGGTTDNPDEEGDEGAGNEDDSGSDSGSSEDADSESGESGVVVAITATPVESNSSSITKINGGAENPKGFDVENGEIVRIGSEVIVWLSKGQDGKSIDHVPATQDGRSAEEAGQVRYYDHTNSSHGSNPNGQHTNASDVYVLHANSQYTTE